MTIETADLRTIVDTEELETTQRVASRPPPPPVVEEVIEQIEAPVVAERRPEVTSHVVDDVFLRTITEKKTIEDIERHRRQVGMQYPQYSRLAERSGLTMVPPCR